MLKAGGGSFRPAQIVMPETKGNNKGDSELRGAWYTEECMSKQCAHSICYSAGDK